MNMKKTAIYFLLFVLLGGYLYLFSHKKLHPKQFILNDKKIEFPDTYLFSINLNGENKQNFFSPLLFSNFNQYLLQQNDEIFLSFLGIDNKDTNYVNILAKKKNKKYLNEFLITLKRKSIEIDSIEKSSCLIYTYKEDSYQNLIIYDEEQTVFYICSFNDKKIRNVLIRTLCVIGDRGGR